MLTKALIPQNVGTVAGDRLELHTPDHLKPFVAQATADVHATVSPAQRNWHENFMARVEYHVQSILVATRFQGIWPGHVRRPVPKLRSVEMPVRRSSDTGAATLTQLVPQADIDQRELERWEFSEAHKQEFEAATGELLAAITADSARLWDTYVHMLALDRAAELKAERDEARKREAETARRDQCPVCGEIDREKNGAVAARALLPRQAMPAVPSEHFREHHIIRSCAACWAVASTALVSARAGEAVAGNVSRRDAVARELGWV